MSVATLTTPVTGTTDEELFEQVATEYRDAVKVYPSGSIGRHLAYLRYNAVYLRLFPWVTNRGPES